MAVYPPPLTYDFLAAQISRPRIAESLNDWSPRPPTSVTRPTLISSTTGVAFLQPVKTEAARARISKTDSSLLICSPPEQNSLTERIVAQIRHPCPDRGGCIGLPVTRQAHVPAVRLPLRMSEHPLTIGVYPAISEMHQTILSLLGDLSLIHISEPTRLGMISYAVFCLKKKKTQKTKSKEKTNDERNTKKGKETNNIQ